MMLQVKQVNKSFGGVRAVDNCSFSVKRGKITALIGPNGSGKSTIFNLINNILSLDLGRILFDGQDITNLAPYKIASKGISRMYQQTRLAKNLKVYENLALAVQENQNIWTALFKRAKSHDKDVRNALQLVGMRAIHDKLAGELSYGQQRLIELARTIINNQQLLLLDEPVAGVNPTIRKRISIILKKLRSEGRTILLIEHDMNFVMKLADEIVVMDEGRVIAKGKPELIRKNKKVIDAYLG